MSRICQIDQPIITFKERGEKHEVFHTADWHLGKLVQGVNMTEDQRYVLEQFIRAVEEEKPDAVVIAGDLYDREYRRQTPSISLMKH